MTKTFEEDFQGDLEDLIDGVLDDDISDSAFDGEKTKFIEKYAPQALPVVPEDVAKWIEDLKSKGYSPLKNPVTYGEAISDLSDESLEKILTWISQHQEEFMRAWLDGYTVEKPQQKRYEVKLLSGESMHFNPIGNPKNIKDYHFSFGNYAGWKTQFTKSELGKIMNGAIYKGCVLPDGHEFSSDCKPWINPLIELVPVEDGE